MKKILAIALALVLVLSLSVAAFAVDGEVEAPAPASATHADVIVEKSYTVTGGDGETIPEETLSFELYIPEGWTNPDSSMITVSDLDTSAGLDITLSFPDYTRMGVYKYNIHEVAGTTLGVTYDPLDVQVIVTVVNEKGGMSNVNELKVYVAVYKLNETYDPVKKIAGDDPEQVTKDFAFVNEYGLGNLIVTKTVTGNLADNTKPFDITVSFAGGTGAGSAISYTLADGTAGTLEFAEDGTASLVVSLKHEDSAVFTNIPAGVTYTVVEDAKHTQGDLNSTEGYTATYDTAADSQVEGATAGDGTIDAGDVDTLKVVNEKKTDIQTGIFLDSLPYVLIAAAVVAALVIMVIRKRRYNED